jgi:methionine-R-sulfoxide reductase
MKMAILSIILITGVVLAAFNSAEKGDAVQKGTADTNAEGTKGPEPGSPRRKDKVIKTDAEWQKILTPEQYRILRKKGTEAAFCGLFHDSKDEGIYSCAGCDLDLFTSDTKFHSGTGWPSFFQPVAKDAVWTQRDTSYGMIRDEVLCARCDGHLGHVFPDGPKPTGLRFCINSDALKFRKKGAKPGEQVTLGKPNGSS